MGPGLAPASSWPTSSLLQNGKRAYNESRLLAIYHTMVVRNSLKLPTGVDTQVGTIGVHSAG